MADDTTKTSDATTEADERDAHASHDADLDTDAPAPPKDKADPKVAKAYEEAMERGANAKGEGAIEGVKRDT